jgi:Holliday junction DNA helicase RuvA
MLYHIKGKIAEILNNAVVIDCNGIGFFISTTNTFNNVAIGTEVKFYISENIKEDCFELYGFTDIAEKECFDLLVTVSGVGPKAAMSILKMLDPSKLIAAIINSDEKTISQTPGIGKKTAQRIIVELKDKVARFTSDESNYIINSVANKFDDKTLSEARNALLVLGYNSQEINHALKEIDATNLSAEEIVKYALKNM